MVVKDKWWLKKVVAKIGVTVIYNVKSLLA